MIYSKSYMVCWYNCSIVEEGGFFFFHPPSKQDVHQGNFKYQERWRYWTILNILTSYPKFENGCWKHISLAMFFCTIFKDKDFLLTTNKTPKITPRNDVCFTCRKCNAKTFLLNIQSLIIFLHLPLIINFFHFIFKLHLTYNY